MKKFGYKKYLILCFIMVFFLIFAIEKCEAQTLEEIIQDKYDMNVKLYPHLNYNWEMFINDGDFIGEFHTLWKLGLPFEEQSNQFSTWYNKEFEIIEKVKNNDTLVYVAIGLILLDIAISRYYYRNQYWNSK